MQFLQELPLQSALLLVALLGAFAYGGADFMGGRAAVNISPLGAVALVQVVALFVTSSIYFQVPSQAISPDVLGQGLLAGGAYAVGLFYLYRGIAYGRVGVVAPVCGVVSILVPLAGDLVLERTLALSQFAGIAICCLAVLLLADSDRDRCHPAAFASVKTGVVSGLGYGTADLCLGMSDFNDGTAMLVVTRFVAAAIALALLARVWLENNADGLYHVSVRRWPQAFARAAAATPDRFVALLAAALLAAFAGICDALGYLCYVHVATQGSMAVAAAIVSLVPVEVLLAVLILRERIFATQYLGIGASAGGLFMLAA